MPAMSQSFIVRDVSAQQSQQHQQQQQWQQENKKPDSFHVVNASAMNQDHEKVAYLLDCIDAAVSSNEYDDAPAPPRQLKQRFSNEDTLIGQSSFDYRQSGQHETTHQFATEKTTTSEAFSMATIDYLKRHQLI
jgi:hypothetical protein